MEKALRQKLKSGGFENVTETRARTMAAIRSRGNKSTEVVLRMAFVRSGIRGWIMHPADVPGKPDFYFPGTNLAIFVDGCFWHGCTRCGHVPKTRTAFWTEKLRRNRARDRRVSAELVRHGSDVLRLWEHTLQSPEQLRRAIARIKTALIRK